MLIAFFNTSSASWASRNSRLRRAISFCSSDAVYASPLADAIIDRIAHDSYRINITSIDAEHDRSMREVYGLNKALRE